MFSCGSSSDHPDNQFRKGPYLVYPGNNTSMTVMWQTYETPVRSTIEWGYTEHYAEGKVTIFENNMGKDGHQFSYTIKGLPHNTRIHYRVTVGGQFYSSSFKTAPHDSDTSLSFYAYGDTILYPDIHNLVVA